jgi:hypothetical protein
VGSALHDAFSGESPLAKETDNGLRREIVGQMNGVKAYVPKVDDDNSLE